MWDPREYPADTRMEAILAQVGVSTHVYTHKPFI